MHPVEVQTNQTIPNTMLILSSWLMIAVIPFVNILEDVLGAVAQMPRRDIQRAIRLE